MPEENKKDLESLPKNVRENIHKQIDNAFLHEKIKEEIMNNPKYDSFFDKFNSSSKESFAETYKWKKANWIEYGDMYLRHEEERLFKYQNIAEQCLWQIQQKKLFNLQCEWRADKIKIPEIEMTWDFKIWENNIKNCSFIDPISEEEVELYKQYIICEDFEKELLDMMRDWQDYDEYKENQEDDDDDENIMPEWYQFYDSRRGTGTLISLPDIRGEKEEFYRDIHFKHERQKQQEEIERQKREGTYKEHTYDKRPYMGAYGEYLDEFVNLFEDEKIKRFYRAYELMGSDLDEDDELQEAITSLLEANEKIEIEGWYDWREAIIKTARKYERKQIYNFMDGAYNEYLQRRAMGISYEKPKEQHNESLSEMIRTQIFHGRKLNGEPEDFNF